MSRRHKWGWLVVAGMVLSCGGSSPGGPKDATQESIASADARVQGPWILVGYEPEIPLEPVLGLLVSSQFGRMNVTFQSGRVNADGAGISVNRKYRIVEAYADHFRAQIYDEFGVSYDSFGDFQGGVLVLHALTAPWRGTATLRRPGGPGTPGG